MTPEERNLVTELFDRLATLEDAQRDPEAERLIRDGLRQAPNALYALVQTVLVQDEALKRADARIRELEGGADAAPRDSSFLGGMRDNLLGRARLGALGAAGARRPGGRVAGLAQCAGQPAGPAGSGSRAGMRHRRRPRDGAGRLVSRHRGRGRGRHDRRLAPARAAFAP